MDINEQEKVWLLQEKYHGVVTDDFLKESALIDQGMPVAYLIDHTPFIHTTIDLSLKPLIPRPETEFWTAGVIIEVKSSPPISSDYKVLDLCAGSGCIGVAFQKEFPLSCVDFADINPENIKQIRINLEKNISDYRGAVFESDLFTNVPCASYQLILSNPPYISRTRKDTVDESVLAHEDPRALFANDNGLEIIKKIITQAPDYLVPQGKLYIEFDPWQIQLIDEFMKTQNSFTWKFQDDQYQKPRVLLCTKR